MAFDFKNDDFRNLLKAKEEEILKRTSSSIAESDNFKRLSASLKTYHKKFSFVGFLAILISKDEIENLNEHITSSVENQLNSMVAATNNHIVVDREFNIIQAERKKFVNGSEVRRLYAKVSEEVCVFQMSNQGIHWFIDGEDFGDAIFFTSEDQDRFNELKSINQLDEVLREYRVHLRGPRDTYCKFFVQNSGKRALFKILSDAGSISMSEDQFLRDFKDLLNNKPEDRFREDLKSFLEAKLKGVFLGEEYILENFRRLDIFIMDDFGELYLVEVKWIGQSIHKDGDRLGTSYDKDDVNPAGIFQSVDYIRELSETGQKIKLGFLAVFDARRGIHGLDTSDGFDAATIEESNRVFYAKFIKIPDLKVVNIHPK